MSGYIGNIPVPQATQTRDTFTATAGQTTFATSGYTPSFLDVFLNGVHLVNGTDYTASNGSDVVLTSGAAAGDTLEVVSYSTFEVNSQTFTGTTTLTGDLQATTATFSGAVTGTDATLSGGVYVGGTVAANYLDDYEEGTWTPSLTSSGTAPSLTYTEQVGYYVKVGQQVTIWGKIRIGTISSAGSGFLRVDGLPFTINSTVAETGGAVGLWLGMASSTGYETIQQRASSTQLFVLQNTTNSSHSVTAMANGGYFRFMTSYIV